MKVNGGDGYGIRYNMSEVFFSATHKKMNQPATLPPYPNTNNHSKALQPTLLNIPPKLISNLSFHKGVQTATIFLQNILRAAIFD